MPKYSSASGFRPAAPSVVGSVSSPVSSTIKADFVGMIDTGAAMTCLPEAVMEKLGPGLEYRVTTVRGAVAHRRSKVFTVNLRVEKCEFMEIEVLCLDKPFALIGRDVLNRYKIVLDGKGGSWSVDNEDC